jgi:hypothetical protein
MAKPTLASVSTPAAFEPPKTFYIQRWDNKTMSVQARSYYKTENTYVFTNLPYSEMRARWNRGTLMEVPPVLEVDVDAVVLIADAVLVGAPPAVRKPRQRKRPAP